MDLTQNPGQDTHAQKQRIQYEITIADSDLKRKEAEKSAVEMELKRLKRQRDLLLVNISEKEQEIKKIDNERTAIDNDIKELKKKLNEII